MRRCYPAPQDTKCGLRHTHPAVALQRLPQEERRKMRARVSEPRLACLVGSYRLPWAFAQAAGRDALAV